MLENDTSYAEGTNFTQVAIEINKNIAPFYYESQGQIAHLVGIM